MTIQDMKSQTVVRFVSDDLDDLIQNSLAPIESDKFTLSIYFGRNLARRYDRLSLHLFNLFQCRCCGRSSPRMASGSCGRSARCRSTAFRRSIARSCSMWRPSISRARRAAMQAQSAKYDLAMLVNAEEPLPPSDEKAIDTLRAGRRGRGLAYRLDWPRRLRPAGRVRRPVHSRDDGRQPSHVPLRAARGDGRAGRCRRSRIDPAARTRFTWPSCWRGTRSRIPRSVIVNKDNIGSIGQELGFPCVLKQPDAAFSLGVVKVESQADARRVRREVPGQIRPADRPGVPAHDLRLARRHLRSAAAVCLQVSHGHGPLADHRRTNRAGKRRYGRTETFPVQQAPRQVISTALRRRT